MYSQLHANSMLQFYLANQLTDKLNAPFISLSIASLKVTLPLNKSSHFGLAATSYVLHVIAGWCRLVATPRVGSAKSTGMHDWKIVGVRSGFHKPRVIVTVIYISNSTHRWSPTTILVDRCTCLFAENAGKQQLDFWVGTHASSILLTDQIDSQHLDLLVQKSTCPGKKIDTFA